MLGGALVENILCLLAYNDQYAPIVRNSVPLNLYGGPYRIIAGACYDYLDRYHTPPKDHLADLLEARLQDDNPESSIYKGIIFAIRDTQANLNVDYVISTLQTFIKRQSFRSIAVEVTKCLHQDTEQSLARVDELFRQASTAQLAVFDPGVRLSDPARALRFLDHTNEAFPTGIKELDARGLGPNRKELWLAIANTKFGKSWLLTHLAKMALIQRLRVCHITLEMSADKVSQRYFQTMYAIAKRPDNTTTVRFRSDDQGRINDFEEVHIKPRFHLTDPDAREQLERIISRGRGRHLKNIIIKEFPTGQLTVPDLKAYLDSLEATTRFVPDLLIIDYPDLMKVNIENPRWSLDQIYKDLRGIAVERNLALAAVSQSNRQGAKQKQVEITNVAEAYSKIQHADVNITMSATGAEKRLGLARLYVGAARNDTDNFALVISQHYKTGAFVVDSHILDQGYWANLEGEGDETT